MQTPSDDGYELFRRAIVDRDASAWTLIHERYQLLLIAWAHQTTVTLHAPENYADIADQVLARVWSALTPARFAAFPTLAAILAYLRTSVSAMMIDLARAERARDRMLRRLDYGSKPTPEEIVLHELDNTALWQLVTGLVETPQDDAVLRLHIMLGLPPRMLLTCHPELFSSAVQVYSAKRNFIGRLQRNRALQLLLADLGA